MPDALSSVRQAVDGAGDLVESREWSPYGVEVGDAQAGLGYTGEWWDAAVGLQVLRARWYDSQTGRFLQEDPWEGRRPEPLTLNAYLYVVDTPTNLVDPTGLKVRDRNLIGDLTEIGQLAKLVGPIEDAYADVGYQYSCNCGWIDWKHALAGMRSMIHTGRSIVYNLGVHMDWSECYDWTGNRGIQLSATAGPVPILQQTAVVPETNLSTSANRRAIAASIFVEHEEAIERLHRIGGPILASGFAEEDLPSDLIGLYIALELEKVALGTDGLLLSTDREGLFALTRLGHPLPPPVGP